MICTLQYVHCLTHNRGLKYAYIKSRRVLFNLTFCFCSYTLGLRDLVIRQQNAFRDLNDEEEEEEEEGD